MVSILNLLSMKNWLTLGLIGGGILAFYKLGGAAGIGSRISGGFSSFLGSFANPLTPLTEAHERGVENLQNPALNPLLVAGAELEAAIFPDPNLAEGRYEPSPGDPPYDPYNPYKKTGGFIQDNNSITKPTTPIWNWQNVVMQGSVIPPAQISPSPLKNNTGGSVGGGQTGGGSTGGRSPSAPSPHTSKASSTTSSTPSSSAGKTGGSEGGNTGGTQPSSRSGTYSGGRR